jgi:hypothetical protein
MTPIALKKITTKDIVGELKAPDKAMQLYYVYGAVTGAKSQKGKYKEKEFLLIGRFEAVRVSDRQEFTAQRLYLPDATYQDSLATTVLTPNADGEVVEPEFAFMIGYGPHAKSPTGYAFTCEPMTDTRAQDRLSNVKKLLNDSKLLERFNLPALEAPKVSSIKK